VRVVVVGLGAIAEKAYLPVLGPRADLELVLCTRNDDRRRALAAAWHAPHAVARLDDAIALAPDAAFVHSSTESHADVAIALLRAGIPVYVDKPLAYSLVESTRIVEEAERAGRLLFVGFNRRFAPAYRRIRDATARSLGRVVHFAKHRPALADDPRRVVFDDFVHVVDTLRFFAGPGAELRDVSGHLRDGLLTNVVVRLGAPGVDAIGTMHRDAGATEESLQLLAPGHTWSVRNLDAVVHATDGREHVARPGDWEPVLHRRGFPQIVDHFLACVRLGITPDIPAREALETHAMCERIVEVI
jgi:virulence factor